MRRSFAKINQPLPSQVGLRYWLTVPGSLTQHLRASGLPLKVNRLIQHNDSARADECASLQLRRNRRVHAREVLLELDGQAVVYARSVTPAAAVRGPWRALLGLGAKPLAELLYTQRGIHRTALHAQRLRPHSHWHRHIRRQLQAHSSVAQALAPGLAQARTLWARHSVFYKRGQALRVMEVFAPRSLLNELPRGDRARRPAGLARTDTRAR